MKVKKELGGKEGNDFSLRCLLSRFMGPYKPWSLECHWIYEPGAWGEVYCSCRYWPTNEYLADRKAEACPCDSIHSCQAGKGWIKQH